MRAKCIQFAFIRVDPCPSVAHVFWHQNHRGEKYWDRNRVLVAVHYRDLQTEGAASMSFRGLKEVLHNIRRTAITSGAVPRTDGQLLNAYVVAGDEACFDALMHRYGLMVYGICRRVLGRAQDAEDAFQTTFLVLVRKAAKLRRRDAVGNWLYGVAYRTAPQARSRAARRRLKEAEVLPMASEESIADMPAGLNFSTCSTAN